MFARPILLLGSLAISAFAQTSIDLFVGPIAMDAQYAASVVNAEDCTTTIALVCTAGRYDASATSIPCDPEETGYVTKAASSYGASTQTRFDGTTYALINECQLDGTTRATCSVTVRTSGGGDSTASSSTTVFSGTQVAFAQVPVTAGAAKLSSQCTASGNAAAPTGVVDVYKVLVVPAAALLAGAMI